MTVSTHFLIDPLRSPSQILQAHHSARNTRSEGSTTSRPRALLKECVLYL